MVVVMNTTFAKTRRIKGKPFSKQVGNDLLIRDKNGNVIKHFGYFSKNTVFESKLISEFILREYKKHSMLCGKNTTF